MLRQVLNKNGGSGVAIDYPLLISNAALNDPAQRKAIVAMLRSASLDSLWLRVSRFGSNATAAGLRKYIAAARDFHTLGVPIVADSVGGLAGLAILAFGAASGISHGTAEKERFDCTNWDRPPPPRDPDKKRGSNTYIVLLPGVDRLLKPEQAEIIFQAPGSRRLLSCSDRGCCALGDVDTFKDPKRHYLTQRASQYKALSDVPEPRRVQHFLDQMLATAERTARAAAKLKVSDDSVSVLLVKNAHRLDSMRTVLEDLQRTEMVASRAAEFPAASKLSTPSNVRGI